MSDPPDPPSPDVVPTRAVALRVWLTSALGLCSLVLLKLSIPALVLSLIVFLSLPQWGTRMQRVLLAIGAAAATVATVRFLVVEAVPGIVQGGRAASAQSAISRLREIVFAEDTLRKKAYVDPDADGIGSAASIAELVGTVPLRGIRTLDPPILDRRSLPIVETAIGPAAAIKGYLVIICLPARAGGWTARPGDELDEEAAERQFVAYAWPDAASRGLHSAFFTDQDERILTSDNLDGADTRYAGPGFPPPCDAALAPSTRADWRAWRDKQPRPELPGDRRRGGGEAEAR
jgi:hypothetical protein